MALYLFAALDLSIGRFSCKVVIQLLHLATCEHQSTGTALEDLLEPLELPQGCSIKSMDSVDIELESSIDHGTLPGGIEFYVRCNDRPSGRAAIALAVKVLLVFIDTKEGATPKAQLGKPCSSVSAIWSNFLNSHLCSDFPHVVLDLIDLT